MERIQHALRAVQSIAASSGADNDLLTRQQERIGWRKRLALVVREPVLLVPTALLSAGGAALLGIAAVQPGAGSLAWAGAALVGAGAHFLVSLWKRAGGPRESQETIVRPVATDEAPEQTSEELSRIDVLCNNLLEQIRRAPRSLRELVDRPEATVWLIRDACRSLRNREALLGRLVNAEDMRRLEQERADLNSRVKVGSDPIVRDRLTSALSFLEDELRERTRLTTAAARLQAEQSRIYYALQNVYTHVVAVNSADAALNETAGDALKQSLSGLSEQVNAVAEALESVAALDLPPVSPVAAPEGKAAADSPRAAVEVESRAAPVKVRH